MKATANVPADATWEGVASLNATRRQVNKKLINKSVRGGTKSRFYAKETRAEVVP